MRDHSFDPHEPGPGVPGARCAASKSAALVRALSDCPGISRQSGIVVLGAAAPTYQLALMHHGFTRVTAAAPRGAALLRERFDGLCVVDLAADGRVDAAALGALRRRLMPSGLLALDVSRDPLRTVLAERLRAAAFRMLQYRVLRIQQPDGSHQRAVFLLARAPRATVRAVPSGSERAALSLGASTQRAA